MRNKPLEKEKPAKKNFVGHLLDYNFDFSVDEKIALKFVPYFVFVTLLGIFYIANNYYAEKVIIDITELDKEVEVLKVDYSTMKYEYINESRREEVARKVKQLGLVENKVPPYEIITD